MKLDEYTESELQEWLDNPVTKAIVESLYRVRSELLEHIVQSEGNREMLCDRVIGLDTALEYLRNLKNQGGEDA